MALLVLIGVSSTLLAYAHPLDVLPGFGEPGHKAAEVLVSTAMATAVILSVYWATTFLHMRREIAHRTLAQAQALELAQHDALTGLPNRRKFQTAFPNLTGNLAPGVSRAVMMLDVDGFKPINDVYGHAFGDSLLRSFAGRIQDTVGPHGFVARLGGDEFAIVTPQFTDRSEVSSLARQLLTRTQESFDLGTRRVSIGTGIGISIFPDDGYSASELLRRADIALYRAKTSGRSAYRFFEVDMDATILHRTLLEQRLRRAIDEKMVNVFFQPILDLETQGIIGFEALARWTDRDFGEVAPTQFISIAEDSGMIAELADGLFREACETAVTWPNDLFLSFNISQVQLHDRNLPLKIMAALSETGLTPDRLVLEVTETAIMRNPNSARVILDQLAAANIKIALDDFGTGHSSLSFLRDLPINTVKIDRSFTCKMAHNKECAAIVEAVLVLSEGLGLNTVAEGIEQTEVLERLHKSGCHQGQGFLFGAAAPADKIPAMLELARQVRDGQAAGPGSGTDLPALDAATVPQVAALPEPAPAVETRKVM
ncbi:hypothetical protein GCM10011316_24830 [Roseibium aquae]|uniref:Diguanylate cyclase/phosphodiesterase n=1 Tax=Roseibium aquae TaxID=1323746 RepID=A0A916TKS0_9HYPH|nr:hypothetical protein GCM10011316_24830 [Roseibium aquae]